MPQKTIEESNFHYYQFINGKEHEITSKIPSPKYKRSTRAHSLPCLRPARSIVATPQPRKKRKIDPLDSFTVINHAKQFMLIRRLTITEPRNSRNRPDQLYPWNGTTTLFADIRVSGSSIRICSLRRYIVPLIKKTRELSVRIPVTMVVPDVLYKYWRRHHTEMIPASC